MDRQLQRGGLLRLPAAVGAAGWLAAGSATPACPPAHPPTHSPQTLVIKKAIICTPQVVLARHRHTGELAALKVVFLTAPHVDEDHLRIMMREAEILPAL